jgi:hypothetical protein
MGIGKLEGCGGPPVGQRARVIRSRPAYQPSTLCLASTVWHFGTTPLHFAQRMKRPSGHAQPSERVPTRVQTGRSVFANALVPRAAARARVTHSSRNWDLRAQDVRQPKVMSTCPQCPVCSGKDSTMELLDAGHRGGFDGEVDLIPVIGHLGCHAAMREWHWNRLPAGKSWHDGRRSGVVRRVVRLAGEGGTRRQQGRKHEQGGVGQQGPCLAVHGTILTRDRARALGFQTGS